MRDSQQRKLPAASASSTNLMACLPAIISFKQFNLRFNSSEWSAAAPAARSGRVSWSLVGPTRTTQAPADLLKVETWLILPVVIRLSQRLSHACLSISIIQRNCEWLIKSVTIYMIVPTTWITVVILELIHAQSPVARQGVFIRSNQPPQGAPGES